MLPSDVSSLQTEAGPGGESAELWARLRAGAEGGDAVRGHHQECGGRARYTLHTAGQAGTNILHSGESDLGKDIKRQGIERKVRASLLQSDH